MITLYFGVFILLLKYKLANLLVLNEVPNSKVKEKQQDKLMINPTAKDDRQQQQSRDREMREAHVEKQNYSISKSRELKVCNFPIYKYHLFYIKML